MPEKLGHGRYNEENKYGDKTVNPRNIVKKEVQKGCPKNDGHEHFYVAEKEIRIWTKNDNKVSVWYNIYCLLCEKKNNTRGRWKNNRNNPTHGYEVIRTTVMRLGGNVPGKFGSIYILSSKVFDGNTDEKGNEIA